MTRRGVQRVRLPAALFVLAGVAALPGCGGDGTATYPGDDSPPREVEDLSAGLAAPTTILLTWTAPGDDGAEGRAAGYRVRYADSDSVIWSRMIPVGSVPIPKVAGRRESLLVSGLQELTRYNFLLKAGDESSNWSDVSNLARIRTGSAAGPGRIDDLATVRMTSSTVTFRWTAVAFEPEGAAVYDMRYVPGRVLDESGWADARPVDGEPAPGTPGETESFEVEGLIEGDDYAFAIRAVAAGGDVSPISNVAAFRFVDAVPPEPIEDLRVLGASSSTVTLAWTAPGDDDADGRAAVYDLRYHREFIDWDTAYPAEGEPVPAPSGDGETFVVAGLVPNAGYAFTVRALDDRGNLSPPGNAAELRTPGREDPFWWDGFAPLPDGQAVDGAVKAMLVFGDRLIVGGEFERAGFAEAPGIAAWSGAAWSPLGSGIRGTVTALIEYQGNLVAAGSFDEAGGSLASNVALWNGSGWEALGAGVDGPVRDLAVHRGDLVVAGDITRAGAVDVHAMARWDGSAWEDAGEVPLETVTAVSAYNNRLYAGGVRATPEGIDYVARFASGRWEVILSYPSYWVTARSSVRDLLVIPWAGLFVGLRHGDDRLLQMWDGFTWSSPASLSGGSADQLRTLGEYDGDLVVGGLLRFEDGGTGVGRADGLDPSAFTSFGGGVTGAGAPHPSGDVEAVAVFQNRLYVGGAFTRAGESRSVNIARWDE